MDTLRERLRREILNHGDRLETVIDELPQDEDMPLKVLHAFKESLDQTVHAILDAVADAVDGDPILSLRLAALRETLLEGEDDLVHLSFEATAHTRSNIADWLRAPKEGT